jgi:hypothetical protein
MKYGQEEHPVEFVITDEYRRGVLINQQTCKLFGLVPPGFPAQVAAVAAEPDVAALRAELLEKYGDVFDGDKPLKPMAGPPMRIKLKEGAEPFKVRGPRPLAIPMKTEAKELLDNFVAQGVLKKVSEPTEWVHGMTLVRKPSGKLRLCVDLRPLNKYVERPHHPLKSPWDVINGISTTAKWFSTFDAAHGYFQVPLAEESQPLTCFLTEWGRYAFKRATMGLVSAGDEYNRRSDEALEGLTGMVKLVDDICIFSDTYEEHVQAIKKFLERCLEHGITLTAEKMRLAQAEVKFAGYLVGRDGIKADPEKLAAIKCFPTPSSLTDLRSFQGLVEQLGHFSTAVAEAMRPLRPLLSPKARFVWTSDHDQAFAAAKKALAEPPVLARYDPSRPTKLETDAARTKGLGYVMRQQAPDGKWMLVEAGSRFISETEGRYSMVELELLAVVWAVKKCRMYLAGLPHFTLVVDHQPLRSILDKKTLDQVETPRIQRLKMALAPYNFTTEWLRGKENTVADALSRAPVQEADREDMADAEELTRLSGEVMQVAAVAIEREDKNCHEEPGTRADRVLREMKEVAEKDRSYQELVHAVQDGERLPAGFKGNDGRFCVDNGLVLLGQRLVVPQALRKEVLRRLHASHQGIERTLRRARQTVFWPGISSDIKATLRIARRVK